MGRLISRNPCARGNLVKPWTARKSRSSAFRMDPNVPLVIPEINAGRIRNHKGIIANPNCAAITALVLLWPIHKQSYEFERNNRQASP